MKFGITKLELFALVAHVVGIQPPSPEIGRRRLRAWDELGVSSLADTLALIGARFPAEIAPADWADATTLALVDLTADVVDFLILMAGQPTTGVGQFFPLYDVVTKLRGRLEQLRDKKYELPPELRDLKEVP